MNTEAIRCASLSVHLGGRTILCLDDLRIAAEEMVTVLGPNGAGKSTFLRCLLGMQGHASGDVRVLGQSVAALGPARLAALRRRIGYVPQLLPASSEIPLTVREVVAIGRTGIAGLLRPLGRGDWAVVGQWIDQLGLAAVAKHSFGELSGGEQRKCLIARAMVQEPELLLLDEPTANLDLGWRERIVETVDQIYRSQPLTVVLVCHELEVIPPSCGRVVVLEDGTVTADGSPQDTLRTERIARLYGGGLSVVHNQGRWAVVPGGGIND